MKSRKTFWLFIGIYTSLHDDSVTGKQGAISEYLIFLSFVGKIE